MCLTKTLKFRKRQTVHTNRAMIKKFWKQRPFYCLLIALPVFMVLNCLAIIFPGPKTENIILIVIANIAFFSLTITTCVIVPPYVLSLLLRAKK